jgi:hypothetical protein
MKYMGKRFIDSVKKFTGPRILSLQSCGPSITSPEHFQSLRSLVQRYVPNFSATDRNENFTVKYSMLSWLFRAEVLFHPKYTAPSLVSLKQWSYGAIYLIGMGYYPLTRHCGMGGEMTVGQQLIALLSSFGIIVVRSKLDSICAQHLHYHGVCHSLNVIFVPKSFKISLSTRQLTGKSL